MVQSIPPPQPRVLLPPLLACLPTSFASPRPPPALLPVLSPILRQRVQLLSATNHHGESWLPLLSWDTARGNKLPEIIQNLAIEPHPSSGEIEFADVQSIQYRRRDEETLEARLVLDEFNLMPMYLWCMTDEASGGPAWLLTELRALDDAADESEWFDSMDEANVSSSAIYMRNAIKQTPTQDMPHQEHNRNEDGHGDDEEDYWNAYDRTPGKTPAKRSPAPISISQMPSGPELEYFARYAMEVQPALDAHDPDEESEQPVETTLSGNSLVTVCPTQVDLLSSVNLNRRESDAPSPPLLAPGHDSPFEHLTHSEIRQPRANSAASSLSGSLQQMERLAEVSSQAEIAIKQHISTDIKSLYRLARSSGIQREEFERVVRTELDMLGMMELDE